MWATEHMTNNTNPVYETFTETLMERLCEKARHHISNTQERNFEFRIEDILGVLLGLLRQHSMLTIKEIIDKAIEQSEGQRRPSPGLI